MNTTHRNQPPSAGADPGQRDSGTQPDTTGSVGFCPSVPLSRTPPSTPNISHPP